MQAFLLIVQSGAVTELLLIDQVKVNPKLQEVLCLDHVIKSAFKFFI